MEYLHIKLFAAAKTNELEPHTITWMNLSKNIEQKCEINHKNYMQHDTIYIKVKKHKNKQSVV